ncbi:hypothetical protein PMI07_005573 [Rhizobium sp. CF080]|uniref:glutathione S-transferase n=1 Tax=Rhizobium sp. (strain CF080) TaxID=1144310 RepID=UPI00027188BC|nr:glutathione S-transferase N-terminal domain-containing protein [Rhizobium sp. CF080]EUB99292.1 hypothetical protein PMI07_005573 [Rhizobium sp. CF080]
MSPLTLLYTPASPFARKVRMAALERRIKLELLDTHVSPILSNPELAKVNPLVKVPVLISPDGPIYDNRVICRYLDRLGEGPSLYASEVAERWSIATLEALSDGVMDAAVLLRYELGVRPEELRWKQWVDIQFSRILGVLEQVEKITDSLVGLHIGSLGLAAALSYLDFRHPALPWRENHPRLSAWLADFEEHEIMKNTRYPQV